MGTNGSLSGLVGSLDNVSLSVLSGLGSRSANDNGLGVDGGVLAREATRISNWPR